MRLVLAVGAAEAMDLDGGMAATTGHSHRAAATAIDSDSDMSSDSEDEAMEHDVIAEIRARLAEPVEDADDAAAATGSMLVRSYHCTSTLNPNSVKPSKVFIAPSNHVHGCGHGPALGLGSLKLHRTGLPQDDLPPIQVLEVEIGEQDVLLPAGKITSVLEGVIVVQACRPRATTLRTESSQMTPKRMQKRTAWIVSESKRPLWRLGHGAREGI